MLARPTACAKAIAVAQALRVGGSWDNGVSACVGPEAEAQVRAKAQHYPFSLATP